MFTMANIAVFQFLLVYGFSPTFYQQWGEQWTAGMLSSPPCRSILMSIDSPQLPNPYYRTHNTHKPASIAPRTCSQKHVQFKPLPPLLPPAMMPLSLIIEVASFLEKPGVITALSVSTMASTASLMTTEGVDTDNDFNLLAHLQGIPIHLSPGPRPSHTRACAPTKTQITAKQKAEKDAKAKTAEE
jgi:hypothetical protein